MQSMIPTTAGNAPNTAASSRSKGDEITVIASTVAPAEKSGQKTESSFSKSLIIILKYKFLPAKKYAT